MVKLLSEICFILFFFLLNLIGYTLELVPEILIILDSSLMLLLKSLKRSESC